MSLAKTLQPPTVVLPEDPVLFGFSSSDMYSQQGVYAEFVLLMSGWPTVGATFELVFGTNIIEFEFISGTSNIPEQLDATHIQGPIVLPKYLYLLKLKDELLCHYLISKNFDITVDGAGSNSYLTFRAKQPGSKYTLSLANPPGFLSTDPAYNVAGVDAVLHSFYSVFLQCYINDTLVGEDVLSPNPQGNVFYDVSAYLKAYATPSFLFPAKAYIEKRPGLLKKFHVRFAERFGTPVKVYKFKSTSGFSSYSLPGGGLSFGLNSKYATVSGSFWDSLQYTKQFLTWQPKSKNLNFTDIEKLFFLVYTNPPPVPVIYLAVLLEFFDSTDSTVFLHSLSISYLDVLELSFSLEKALSLYTGAGTRLFRATVYLGDVDGNPVSEKRYYYPDPLNYMHSHRFIWRNSFGMYDTDRFTGKKIQSVSSEKQIYTYTNTYTFNNIDPPTQILRSTEVEMFDASTGWMDDKERADWLRELFLSREVYEIIGNNLFPVVITSGKIEIVTEGKTQHNVHFQYTRAYTDEHFSRNNGYITAKFQQSFQQQFVPTSNQ